MNFRKLEHLNGIVCAKPASEAALRQLPVTLPPKHLEFLRFADGLTAAHGYLRVFGVGDSVRSQIRWNGSECWRFAWPDRCAGFWFFAETAHGSQFAYEFDENGALRDRVVSIGQFMVPAWTLADFQEFIENAVLRHPDTPSDPLFEPTLRRLGSIPPNKHVVPVPHPCLGGDWASEDVMLIDARTAMIMNADLWAEINRFGDVEQHSRMETYIDQKGRTRFRIGRDQ